MDDKRKGEIALAVVKYRLIQTGIHLNSIKRDLGNISQSMGISSDELMEFAEFVTRELVDETFGEKK